MQKKINFDTFLESHGDEFHAYLGEKAYEAESDKRYRELSDELNELYDKHSKLARLMKFQEADEMSKEECEALLEAMQLQSVMDTLEWEKIYFQGCADCVSYLKRMNLL